MNNNSNVLSTPIHSTRQNGPQTNSPPVNSTVFIYLFLTPADSQMNNKINVVSINVKTGEFIPRYFIYSFI